MNHSSPVQALDTLADVRIVPLSQLEPRLLIDYLGSRGIAERVVRWKYFDAVPNPGRERGYAAVRNDRVVGFLGMIPVRLVREQERQWDNWLCDWSIQDPERDRGLGGALARFALASAGRMIAFGGTKAAQLRWPRYATRSDEAAGVVYRKQLTLLPYVRWFQARRLLPKSRLLDRIGGIQTFRMEREETACVVREGVAVPDAILKARSAQWQPSYTREDLDWQLDRCPDIKCWTILGPGADAILAWRSASSPVDWRFAILSEQADARSVGQLLSCAVRHVHDQGGSTVRVLVSRTDVDLIRPLLNSGFRKGRSRLPIHFVRNDAESCPSSLRRLSYLDTDLGHRF